MKFFNSTKKGFTLIETLVVISIIGILMGISLVAFQNSRSSARDAKRKADLESIRSALELSRSDSATKTYPVYSGSTATSPSAFQTQLASYLSIPADPITGQNYYYISTAGTTYKLCARLETGGTVGQCGGANCGTGANSCNIQVINP